MTMRTMASWIVLAVGLCVALPAAADTYKLPDVPEKADFAPPEHVIIARPALESRPKGSLLAKAQHEPRQVDTDELLERKYSLYEGGKAVHSLSGPEGDVAPAHTSAARPLAQAQGQGFARVAFWFLICGSALLSVWLLVRSFINFWRKKPAHL